MGCSMQISKRNTLLIGLTLFSMFFGAGNLIFPPFLAYQSGSSTWLSMLGFSISAIGFPILGIIAIAKAGGIDRLAGRVSPWFAQVFILLAYLSIGPGLAIPRNSITSFEMAVLPFLGIEAPVKVLQFIYSALFFVAAAVIALRPEKLTDRLGKVLTPILLILIVILFFGCIFGPNLGYGSVDPKYQDHAPIQGFLDGYQTMDAIAALNFGFIIALNIHALGVDDRKEMLGVTKKAGIIAGVLLLLVYSLLAHIGGVASNLIDGATNGARTLTGMVDLLFGPVGTFLLAGIFVIACLNTCIGLLSSCSDYFVKLLPKTSYRGWVMFFAAGSLLVANLGLDTLLAISVPILETIYPVCILLIILGICHHLIEDRMEIYPISVAFTSVVSILALIDNFSWCPSFICKAVAMLPLAEEGLPWILPAAVGIAIGFIASEVRKRNAAR